MVRRTGISGATKWGILGGVVAGGIALAALRSGFGRLRATTILKGDHRVARGMLKTLEMTPRVNGAVRRRLVGPIYNSLMAHERAEDEVVYAAIRNRGYEPGPQFTQASEEQSRLQDLLDELKEADPTGDLFDDRLRELGRLVRAHADREERYVFPVIEDRLSDEEQQELGRELRTRKRDFRHQIPA